MKHYRIVYSSTVLSDRRRSTTYTQILSLVRACAVRTPKRYGSKQLSRDCFFAAAVEFVVVSLSLSSFSSGFSIFLSLSLKPGEADKQTSYQEIPRLTNTHAEIKSIEHSFFLFLLLER